VVHKTVVREIGPCNFLDHWSVEKETMGNRSAGYWVLLVIAIGMAVAGFVVRSSPDPQKHAMAQYLGWGAIALLLIARFFFRRKPDTTPPMPRD